MRVIHISTFDRQGGAARSAWRLHMGLRDQGVDSTMFVSRRSTNDPTVQALSPPDRSLSRVYRLMRREWIAHAFAVYRDSQMPDLESFSDDRTAYGSCLVNQLPPCDLLNLHWVAGMVDHRSFFRQLDRGVPIVWTLHDMNPFTGGCHYTGDCRRFEKSCGACPLLGSRRERDLSRRIWERKRWAYAQVRDRLYIVTPSRWLAAEVARSSLMGDRPVRVIPYGLDLGAFAPRDRDAARKALGIPSEAKVVLFAAQSVRLQRKGLKFLFEALRHVKAKVPELAFVSFGGGEVQQQDKGISNYHFGYIESDRLMSVLYSAADVFVLPSIEDNLPNTVLEAMACGAPIVAFAVGGIPEMVVPGETGLLAPLGDVFALSQAIERILTDDDPRRNMGMRCRKHAEANFSLELQAQRYIDLYRRLLGQPVTSTS